MWTIIGTLVKPSYGFCTNLDEAKAKFVGVVGAAAGV
jgi:hypothetical protein